MCKSRTSALTAFFIMGFLYVLSVPQARATTGNGGFEFQVNTVTAGDQTTQRGRTVAQAPSGRFAVVFTSSDGDGDGAFVRVYDEGGVPVGPEILVNETTSNNQRRPDVAMANDGTFTVVWRSSAAEDGSGQTAMARRFAADGTALSGEFVLNTYTTGNQFRPVVGYADDGSFVATWTSAGQDGSSNGVFGQRYNASAVPIGTEFQINTTTGDTQMYSQIAVGTDGRFIVIWQALGLDGSSWGVGAQRYDSSGLPQGTEFIANSNKTGLQAGADVAINDAGESVIIWDSENQDGSSFGQFAQMYDSAGAAVGTEFQVNTGTLSSQRNPSAIATSATTFTLIWHSFSSDGSGAGIVGQCVSPAGAFVGGEFQVNTHTLGTQMYADIASTGDDTFVVAWRSDGQDGSGLGVYARLFGCDNGDDDDSDGVGNLCDRCEGFDDNLDLDSDGVPDGCDVCPAEPGGDLDGDGLCPAVDNCPDDANVGQEDADADGVGDACDVCAEGDDTVDADGDGVPDACDICVFADGSLPDAVKPKIRFKFVNTDATFGNDRIAVRAEFVLSNPLGFTVIDPLNTPVRVRVSESTGDALIDVTLPTVSFGGSGTAGWTVNGKANKWSFKDKTGSPAAGISGLSITDRSKKSPGQIRIKVVGKDAPYDVDYGSAPVNALFTVGDPIDGDCVETGFTALDCQYLALGQTLSCR